jgi:hypothetical protein
MLEGIINEFLDDRDALSRAGSRESPFVASTFSKDVLIRYRNENIDPRR